ncbi:thiamine pyrophosphate-dependent enzyme [Rhizobium sp. S95]|uniref:Thiamine pyrophosphate-dependent enzyme n=1 Tax=Ciceribacter sichuanensis TaxID=2949647 RepID=A0AAJ1C1B4_9HYPH|nr:thiamine pyrophosphate-dependent enzyme [Ciceribacter sp. S95]MCO5959984.1 thiamine pyrophosphate-dependent enzyme [Ciceribacter sp. S101]
MGDLIGEAVEGTLYYITPDQFDAVRNANLKRLDVAGLFADMCRLNALYMIARAGSGHIGSSFSSMDIFSWLLLEELKEGNGRDTTDDVFFSSKGHDAPGYYSVLMALKKLPFDLIHKLRDIEGLPGHPDVGTPSIVTNTGSLGMGISKAKGMVAANRLAGKKGRVFVLTGDGELQEGQIWESLGSAVNSGLGEIVVIVDHNKLQSDTFVKNVSDLGDLEAKFESFGWRVARVDGNDLSALSETLRNLDGEARPKVIIADTVKGKGVSFMEHTSLDSDVDTYAYHSGAPNADAYRLAAQEIMARLSANCKKLGIAQLLCEKMERVNPPAAIGTVQKLIPAYSDALLAEARKHSELVALDADLVLDTGLIPFREAYPKRFFECGIAEQDMVSTAGGMAINGLLPVVHSFACFLSTRPNEQIYNNCTEQTKIIYVGSLAGVIPGGPGHSHQSVRDISALAAMPGMTLVEPSCAAEVGPLLSWCVNDNDGSSYMRLVSVPVHVSFELPAGYKPVKGQGSVLREGKDIAIITYGMVLLNNAYKAAVNLAEQRNVEVKVINLPWLNAIDSDWLAGALEGFSTVISLDNHYVVGGQGDAIGREIAKRSDIQAKLVQAGVESIPPSGTNDQVLKAVGLDVASIEALVLANI